MCVSLVADTYPPSRQILPYRSVFTLPVQSEAVILRWGKYEKTIKEPGVSALCPRHSGRNSVLSCCFFYGLAQPTYLSFPHLHIRVY